MDLFFLYETYTGLTVLKRANVGVEKGGEKSISIVTDFVPILTVFENVKKNMPVRKSLCFQFF